MARQIEVNLLVKSQTEAAEKNIQRLSETLQKIATTNVTVQSGSLDKAVQSAQQLQIHLQNAINTKTNKIDLTALNTSLQKAGTSLTALTSNLQGAGTQGQQAFLQVARAISQAEVPMVRMNGALARFGTTLLNTVKWQIASKIIHGIQGSLQGAFQHAKNLNAALNSIQIVTGSSAEYMADFAEKARAAATALNATTTEYAKASLIFFQQGLDEKAAMDRTNVVIKLSQVTGQAVDEIASQMTAIWNNFDDGTESLEHYADVITALGAKTAASSAEIAQGMQKFAAVAETVGLSYEKAAAALATIVATTRQSEDVVGTALKTILARVDSLKLGETLDDDVTLNKYAKALQTIGVNILDSNQNLKDMDTILNELGNKWKLISEAQKVAVAETVAGQRQYAQFMALMNNYDTVLENQGIAENAEGTLQQQAEIWSDSWEAAAKRVEQAQKNLYDSMISSDFMIKMEDLFGSMLKGVSSFIDTCGGILPVFGAIMAVASTQLLPLLMKGFSTLSNNIAVWTGKASQDFAISQGAIAASLQNTLEKNTSLTEGEKLEIQLTQDLLTKKAALTLAIKNMTEVERAQAQIEMANYENKLNIVQASVRRQIEAEKEVQALEKLTAAEEKQLAMSLAQSEMRSNYSNNSLFGNKLVETAANQSMSTTRNNITSLNDQYDNKMTQMENTSSHSGAQIYQDTKIVKGLEEQQQQLQTLGLTGSTAYKKIEDELIIVNARIEDNLQKLEQMNVEESKLDRISTAASERKIGQLAKEVKSLDGYQQGTLKIIDDLDQQNRVLQVQIKMQEKLLELRNKNIQPSQQSYGAINKQEILHPFEQSHMADASENTQTVVNKLSSSTGSNDIAISEENYQNIAVAAKEAQLAQQDLANMSKVVTSSYKDMEPFSAKYLKDKKEEIRVTKEKVKESADEVNKKRLEIRNLKDRISVDGASAESKKKLKTLTKELADAENDLNKKQNAASLAIKDYRSSSTEAQRSVINVAEAVNDLKTKFTFSQEATDAFDKALEDLANNPSEDTVNAFNSALAQLEKEANTSAVELDSLREAVLEAFPTGQRERIDETTQALERKAEATHDAEQQIRQLTEAELEEQETEKARQQAMNQNVQKISKMGSTISQLVMGFQALRNVSKVWSDEDASVIDKITNTMMSLAMFIPVLVLGYKALTSAKVQTKVADLALSKAYAARAVAAAAAWAAEHPLMAGVVIAAIATTTAAVIGLTKAHKERAAAAEAASRTEAIDTAKSMKQVTDKAIEQSSAIDSLIIQYKNLKNAGQDYTSVQDDIISKTAEMISAFNDLAKELKLSGDKLNDFNYLSNQLKVAQASGDVEAVERIEQEISDLLIAESAKTYKKGLEAAEFNLTNNLVANPLTLGIVAKNFDIKSIKEIKNGEVDLKDIIDVYYEAIQDPQVKDKTKEKLKKQLSEVVTAYEEASAADSTNLVWDIVNQNKQIASTIITQSDFDKYKEELVEQVNKTAKSNNLDKDILLKELDNILTKNAFLEPYQLNEIRFDTIEKNIGKETADKLKKDYDENWDEETKKAFSGLSFDNIFSEKTLKTLIEFQKSLNIESAAYDAIDGLEQVNEKLKATGMSAKAWEEVEAGLQDSGLDIDMASFRALSYEEQKNIIDTAKKQQLQIAVTNNQTAISQLEEALKNSSTYTSPSVNIPNIIQKLTGIKQDEFSINFSKDQIKNFAEQENKTDYSHGRSPSEQTNSWLDILEQIQNEEELLTAQLNEELKKQATYVADFGEQIRNASSLQELDSLTQEGNRLFSFLDQHYETTGYYQQALINIAGAYDNAADEVVKYQMALTSSNETMQKAAEESLRLSIVVGQLAEQYDLEAEDVEIQAKLINDAYTSLSGEGAARLAVQNQRINKGVADLNKNFKDWNKTLTTADKFSTDYASTLQDVFEAIANLTGATSADAIAIDFLNRKTKSGTAILTLLEQATKGDIKAIQELTKEVALSSVEMAEFQEKEIDDTNWLEKTFSTFKKGILFDGLTEDFETTKAKILEGIETLYNNIDDLAPGTTITEELLGQDPEEFVARLNKMAYETHMSVESMNALLSQIGVDIPVETEYIPVARELPEYATVHTVTERDDNGSFTEIVSQKPTGHTTTVYENVPVAKIGKNAKVIKYTGGAKVGGISDSSTATNPTSSTPKRESTKNTSDETERYHVINKETDQLTKAYDRLNTAKDRAFGANRLKLMDAEIANTKKQIALNKEYIKEAKSYAQQDYNNLINGKQNAYTIDGQWYSSEGLRGLGVELQLDENGVIQNYDEIMAAATTRYNERIAAYNANPENSNFKEIADAEFNSIKELISQYEESNELVQDKLDENQKLINQLQDQNLEKFNYKLELKFKISDREKKRIEFELREIGDDAFKSVEALSKMFSTDSSPSQWSVALDDLKTYEQGFNDLNDLYAKGEISEEGYVEGLEKVSDGIYEQLETVLDLKDTMEDYYSNTLSKLKEKYDELRTAMSHTTEVLEHLKTVLNLSGRGQDFSATGALLETEAEAQANAYNVSKANYEKDVRLFKQREKELAEARKNGGKEQIKIAEENYKDAREAMNASELEMYNDLESWLQARWSLIENATASTADQYGKMMTDGMGFDYLNQVMTLSEKTQERYLTKTNQIYETEKLRRKLQQDLDKTTNAAARQRIALFDRELQALRDKNELSKTELSLAQGRYELLLAQIALEEAQNAKTTVRLQRDTEGNYGYVYTADQNAIAEAEQNAADAENNLYNTAREAQNELVKEMFSTQQEYSQAIADLWNNQELSTEEKQQRETELRAQYNDQMSKLAEELGIADIALATWSATRVNDTWTATYTGLAKRQTEFNANSEALWDELRVYLVGKDGEGGAFKIISDAANNVLGVSLTDLKTKTYSLTAENKKLKEELIGADGKGGLVKATEEEANAVTKTTIEFGKAYDKADAYFKKLKKINEQIDELIKKATEDIVINTKYEDTHNVKYNFTYTHTGNPPPEYKNTEVTVTGGRNEGDNGDKKTGGEQYKVSFVYVNQKNKAKEYFFDSQEEAENYFENMWNKEKDRYPSLPSDAYFVSDSFKKVEIFDPTNKLIKLYKGITQQVYKNKYGAVAGLDTGGYTGTWYHSSDDPMMSGKLAMLHEKELVLNQEDTKNFLASVEMVRDLARIIDLQAASVGLRQQLEARFGFDAAQSELAQNIVINADFPNATDHNEIMEAFETLADRAAQYANRADRTLAQAQ